MEFAELPVSVTSVKTAALVKAALESAMKSPATETASTESSSTKACLLNKISTVIIKLNQRNCIYRLKNWSFLGL